MCVCMCVWCMCVCVCVCVWCMCVCVRMCVCVCVWCMCLCVCVWGGGGGYAITHKTKTMEIQDIVTNPRNRTTVSYNRTTITLATFSPVTTTTKITQRSSAFHCWATLKRCTHACKRPPTVHPGRDTCLSPSVNWLPGFLALGSHAHHVTCVSFVACQRKTSFDSVEMFRRHDRWTKSSTNIAKSYDYEIHFSFLM